MPRSSPPSYRLHKPSGLAVIRLNGKDFYLGKHGSPASRREYDRVVGEWLAKGRKLETAVNASRGVTDGVTVSDFYKKAEGSNNSEAETFKQVLRPLRHLYGTTPNAVQSQLWIAVIVYVLVVEFKHRHELP